MNAPGMEIIGKVRDYVANTLKEMENDCDSHSVVEKVRYLSECLPVVLKTVPYFVMVKYSEFFTSFATFCSEIKSPEQYKNVYDEIFSSMNLVLECLDTMENDMTCHRRVCSCCGKSTAFLPLPQIYFDEELKNKVIPHVSETLNRDEYYCSKCGALDRDRLMLNFLKDISMPFFKKKAKLLQFAPSGNIENWITQNCPKVEYESTDLFMDDVTFKADIQNLNMIEDGTYDFWICSHVLEHVQDDRKALLEMKRILKNDGIGLFLVPVSLDMTEIDEEWGLPESENWRRFGQGDHCRRYGKEGLLKRIREAGFCVSEYNKECIDSKVFAENAFLDTSTLYILTKKKTDIPQIMKKFREKVELSQSEMPLVSVCMSAYNHEPFVEEAILSVLNQTYKNIEFLVADDCSDDKTADVLKKYSDRFTYEYYAEKNYRGLAAKLVHEAKGKYICLMNSDDVWELDKLEKQLMIMERNPQYAACFCWCEYVDENLEVIENDIFKMANRSKYEWLRLLFEKEINRFCHPSIMIKREIYQNLLTWKIKKLRQLPDYYMWVKLLQKHEIYVLQKNEVKMRHFINGGRKNMSASTAENSCRDINENTLLWYFEMKNMEDEVFARSFADKLKKNNLTPTMIKCEKYLLCAESRNEKYLVVAMLLFFEWYDDDDFRDCLINEYNYDIKSYYDITSLAGFPKYMLGFVKGEK